MDLVDLSFTKMPNNSLPNIIDNFTGTKMSVGISGHLLEPAILSSLNGALTRIRQLDLSDLKFTKPISALLEVLVKAESLEFINLANN